MMIPLHFSGVSRMTACCQIAVALGALGTARAAVIADFATDFSSVSNPSGQWSYGAVTALGGPMTLDTLVSQYGPSSEVAAWSPAGVSWPTVGLNTSSSSVSFGAGNSITLAPGQGILHPGPTGNFADVRYTAATSITGHLTVVFSGVSSIPTTTDAHVLLNGASLLSGSISSYGGTQSYSAPITLAPGDVLEFAVGWGANADFNDDSTGFVATLSTVPEPGTAGLLVLGGICGAAVRRRSHRAV